MPVWLVFRIEADVIMMVSLNTGSNNATSNWVGAVWVGRWSEKVVLYPAFRFLENKQVLVEFVVINKTLDWTELNKAKQAIR